MKFFFKNSKTRTLITFTLLFTIVLSISISVAFTKKCSAGCYHSEAAHNGNLSYRPTKISKMKQWQTYMNTHYSAHLEVDGHFGPKSQWAAFRTVISLYSNAYGYDFHAGYHQIEGSVTRGFYLPKNVINEINKYPISQGARNNEIVRFFQYSFSCFEPCYDIKGIDGIFGPGTKNILSRTTEWSNAKGRYNTNPNKGIIDYETWHALFQWYY